MESGKTSGKLIVLDTKVYDELTELKWQYSSGVKAAKTYSDVVAYLMAYFNKDDNW